MTIKEIHDFIFFILDKEITGMPTHGEVDQALDRASIETFKNMLPFYNISQTYTDALAPFKTTYVFTNGSSENGIVTMPSSYMRFLSLMVMVYDNETEENKYEACEFVNADEIAERTKSQLRPLSIQKPVAHWTGKGQFQLFPNKPNTGKCIYLRRPARPVYAFTQSGRTVSYQSGSSTQLEWGEIETNTVIYRALQLLGVNLSDEKMIQYTQLKAQEP